MINTIFFELLLFCTYIAAPVDGVVRFHMIEKNQNVAAVEARLLDKKRAQIVLTTDGRREVIESTFIDNGLYKVDLGRDKVKVDIAQYFIGYYPGEQSLSRPAKGSIKDSSGNPLWIQNVDGNLYVSSPTEQITFVIPAGHVQQGKKK